MARFQVLTVGKSRVDWAQSAVDDYTQRLRRHGGIEERSVRVEPYRGDVDSVRV